MEGKEVEFGRARLSQALRFQQADPSKRRRTKPMEILCIGMPRTGTASIAIALAALGYDGVYHMASVINNPTDSRIWKKAFDAKYYGKGKPFTRDEWDQLLGETQVCLDLPSAAFMPELIAAYPEAKVIIAQRDPEKWYKSFYETVVSSRSLLLFLLAPFDGYLLRPYMSMLISMDSVFGKRGLKDKENAIQIYNGLHDEVRALVPESNRLEYSLGQGWGPLCKFLEKKVPKCDFPHINETNAFKDRVNMIKSQASKRVAKSAVPWVIGAIVLIFIWFGLG